jgi:FkbM family methyltransferase
LGQKAAETFLQRNKPSDNGYLLVVDYYKLFLLANLVHLNPNPTIPERPIFCFVADGGFKSWSGSSIVKEGVGGSETYIIEMARNFVKHTNFEVVVFCKCEKEEIFQGVKYVHLDRFYETIGNIKIKHCMISRFSEYLLAAYNSHIENVHLVVHDLSLSGSFIPLNQKLKNIFCLTEWHKKYFCNIFPELTHLTKGFHYGIDFTNFQHRESDQKVKHSFIYSSFANRGLIVLLKMWPRILERYPDATLNVFADLNNSWANQHYPEEMKQIREIFENGIRSVTLHGWVNKETLGKYWRQSEIWVYPCKFQETFCLTALEAALSKTFAITNNLAALEDTVGDRGATLYPGDVLDPLWQDKALNTIFEWIDNKDEKTLLIEKNYQWALQHSWEQRAIELLKIICPEHIIGETKNILLVNNYKVYEDSFLEVKDMQDLINQINLPSKQILSIDCNASVGLFCSQLSKLSQRVIAFETKNYQLLLSNLNRNNIDNVSVLKNFVGNKNILIENAYSNPIQTSDIYLTKDEISVKCNYNMLRLDDLLFEKISDIKIIKIDDNVEDVIIGAMNLIFEFNPYILIKNNKSIPHNIFTNIGYETKYSNKSYTIYHLRDKLCRQDNLNYAGMYNWTHDLPPNSKSIFENVILSIKNKTDPEILEIGTYAGTSLIYMLQMLPLAKAVAIDRWKSYDEDVDGKKVETLANLENINVKNIFDKNILKAGMKDRITCMQGDSEKCLTQLLIDNKKFDFIYVDGSHRCLDCFLDCVLSWKILKTGGIMAIDDYQYKKDDKNILEIPFYGVNEFLKKYQNELKIISIGYRVFIQKNF